MAEVKTGESVGVDPGLGRWPEVAPSWATVFGEDDRGIFAHCEVRGVPFAWRWIPSGRFRMGSPIHEMGRYHGDPHERPRGGFVDEGPLHEVNITRGFWLGEMPVVQCQWEAVMGGNSKPSFFKGRWHPVEQVNWDECMAMAKALSDLVPGLEATLPTEAQWEYACRAGSHTALYHGDIFIRGHCDAPHLDAIAWYSGNSGRDLEMADAVDASKWPERQYPDKLAATHRVGLKDPNGWGLHDMIGNVWEWCRDGKRKYTAEEQWDPGLGDDASLGGDNLRLVRGGSWAAHAKKCRSAQRLGVPFVNRWYDLGFRLIART